MPRILEMKEIDGALWCKVDLKTDVTPVSLYTSEELKASQSLLIEECAMLADAHIGAAERAREAKGWKPPLFHAEEAMASIRDEERGEAIAAQMIAADIRKLK